MFKAIIKKNNIITNSAEFNTLQLAQEWIDNESLNGSFGKLEREFNEQDAIQNGELLENAVSSRIEIVNDIETTIYTFSQEFISEIVDISAEVEKQRAIEYGLKAQNFGALMIAKVNAINEAKNLNSTQFNALLADQTLQNIERALWNGSMRTALALVNTLDNTFFTLEEKQEILNDITNFLIVNNKL